MQGAFSVLFDMGWPGCAGISGTSRDLGAHSGHWEQFDAGNVGLILRSLCTEGHCFSNVL